MAKTRKGNLKKYRRKTVRRKNRLHRVSKKSKKVLRKNKRRNITVKGTRRVKNHKTRRKMSGGSAPLVDEYYFYTSLDPDSHVELNEIIKITRVEDNGNIYFKSQTLPFDGADFLTIEEFTEMHNNKAFQILGPLEEHDKGRTDILKLRDELREKLKEEILQRKQKVAPPPPTPPLEEQSPAPTDTAPTDTAGMVSEAVSAPTATPRVEQEVVLAPTDPPRAISTAFYHGDPSLEAEAAMGIEYIRAKRRADLLAETRRGLDANRASTSSTLP